MTKGLIMSAILPRVIDERQFFSFINKGLLVNEDEMNIVDFFELRDSEWKQVQDKVFFSCQNRIGYSFLRNRPCSFCMSSVYKLDIRIEEGHYRWQTENDT